MPDRTITTAPYLPTVRSGDFLDVGGERGLVVAVEGCMLTVRPCPWWRWALSRLATALRRAKWWAPGLVEPWLPDA